ncbi:hypothetical protein WN944_028713 [Citrus x changshan-huyou]|uniref:CASP-like protein n=1 Tax=Citrus x changshan-huyou TaxID=2935761 RepID=A0AAP0LPE8_9ROSI
MAITLSKGAIALFLVTAVVSRVSVATVYKVGVSAGWSVPAAERDINFTLNLLYNVYGTQF